MKKILAAVLFAFLLLTWLAMPAGARSIDQLKKAPGDRIDQVSQFNMTGPYQFVGKEGPRIEDPIAPSGGTSRHSVGSALSPEDGIGVGVSIALTYNDTQYGFPSGRYLSHYWNGLFGAEAQAGVHFVYDVCSDSTPGYLNAISQSGYNLYEATGGGDWPRGPDQGCILESDDPDGEGLWGNVDVASNGTAIIASNSRFSTLFHDNRLYYQQSYTNCTYTPTIATSYITPAIYRPNWHLNAVDNYSASAEVQTQYDGSNTIVHVLLGEEEAFNPPAGDNYVEGELHRIFAYFRKVGDLAADGSWSSGQVIDTILQLVYPSDPFGSNAVSLFPSSVSPKVCISYSNPTAQARRRDGPNARFDVDVYYRESLDYGLTWGNKVDVTNFDNATEGSPNHFKAWFESPCFYDSNDDLHIIWTGTPTSANPYFDGYNWNDFDTDIYHWARSSGEIVQVANGSYLNDDWLTGTMNGSVCGFAGQRTGYIYFIWLAECDSKLYCVWNQIHERANRFDWRSSVIQPAPGILDDCGYEGAGRYGIANSEIMMSVAYLTSSSLWDAARNISNTYTPDCGLPGDDNRPGGDCGNEWKVAVEKFAFDQTGLALTWPAESEVDVTPGGGYAGDWYLNLQYLDDQYPGGFIPDTRDHNAFGSLNSEKWIRLACVEPVPASEISTSPRNLEWPHWVRTGQTADIPVIVKNTGNVPLNVSLIGVHANTGSWLSVSETQLTIPAGVLNTDTFNIQIIAGSQTTWLDGWVWLKSDAVNADSLVIPIHVLAADTVEPVIWDTVATHADMYNVFIPPAGTCVGLAVGNMGELGLAGLGTVNLDYVDASGSTSMPLARRECDTTRSGNLLYLVSATPFVITATGSDGSGALLTQCFNDVNQADENGFDPTPDKGTVGGGVTAGGAYDSVYTGRFVNRDTSIAMERIVYGPRSTHPATDTINFMIIYTKVYSGDGLVHNHLTIGNAADWDVPADNYNHNLAGIGSGFVYLSGTDTAGHDDCASHVGRYATEAFGGGYTSAEYLANSCANSAVFRGSGAVEQILMVDSTENNGVPVSPAQPNPLAWWQMASVSGLHFDPTQDTGRDYCTFTTYMYDHNLGATDTLHYWTVMTTTPIGGTLGELTAQVNFAKKWYTETVRGCSGSCCVGRVGDANMSGEAEPDEVTLGDIMLMVDVKFISGDCTKLTCILEADVNQDGGSSPTCDDHVTLGDIMVLVDHLFISNTPLKTCL